MPIEFPFLSWDEQGSAVHQPRIAKFEEDAHLERGSSCNRRALTSRLCTPGLHLRVWWSIPPARCCHIQGATTEGKFGAEKLIFLDSKFISIGVGKLEMISRCPFDKTWPKKGLHHANRPSACITHYSFLGVKHYPLLFTYNLTNQKAKILPTLYL